MRIGFVRLRTGTSGRLLLSTETLCFTGQLITNGKTENGQYELISFLGVRG
jgi:hypothetical protein